VNKSSDIREALIAEAIGDVGRLMRDLAALAPLIEESRASFLQANDELREALGSFESRVVAITDKAKLQTVRYMAAKTDEATRRSIDQQGRAMADAARIALGAEVGATMQRWQAAWQSMLDQPRAPWWEVWLTHIAAAVAGSAATWAVAVYLGRA
jgi:hypothetical protein